MSFALCSFPVFVPPRPAYPGGGIESGFFFGALRFASCDSPSFPLRFFVLLLLCFFSFSHSQNTLSLSAVGSKSEWASSVADGSSWGLTCSYSIGSGSVSVCPPASFSGSCKSVSFPPGSSVSFVSGVVSGSGSLTCGCGSGSASCSGDFSCTTGWSVDGCELNPNGTQTPASNCQHLASGYCTAVFDVSFSPPPPSCSDFLPISAPVCKGGQGLWFADGHTSAMFRLEGMFGLNYYYDNLGTSGLYVWNDGIPTVVATQTPSPIDTTNNTTTRPDGSKCSLFGGGDGVFLGFTICPQGFEEEPSSSSAAPSSSSVGSSSDSGGSSGSGASSNSTCVCVGWVDNECSAWVPFGCDKDIGMSAGSDGGSSANSSCYCIAMIDGGCTLWSPGCDESSCTCVIMVDGVCDVWDPPGCEAGGGGGSIGGDGEGEGGGISCKMLSNCDWAKLNVQLQQLGVEVQIRDAIRDMLSDLRGGNSLSAQQLALLKSISDALNRSASSGGGSAGSGGNASAGSGWPGGACDPRVSDCTMSFPGMDGDTAWGVTKGYLDGVMSSHGLDSVSLSGKFSYSRILQDTTKIFPGMRRAVAPFNNYIRVNTQGCGTVLDFSFSIGGFSCDAMCKINLSSFGGYPVGAMMSDFMTIAFGLGVLVRLLMVVRTFGHGD